MWKMLTRNHLPALTAADGKPEKKDPAKPAAPSEKDGKSDTKRHRNPDDCCEEDEADDEEDESDVFGSCCLPSGIHGRMNIIPVRC